MQRPQSETVTLDDILITGYLSQRAPRSPNLLAENQAMRSLARQMVNAPEVMLQSLVQMAVELCQAGTAGVSLLDTAPSGEEIFCWNVLAGTLAQYVGGTTPRHFSPCGVCLDHNAPVLFSHPERYFTDFQAVNMSIVEGLVLPLRADNHVFGTIWIMSHDEQRFDSEDVRIMTSLADFTAAVLVRNQQQTGELLAINAALKAEITERKQAEEQLREVQRRLELSLTGANLGVWTYKVGTDEFWADDRAKLLHGHAPHEEVHNFAQAGANIHPSDRDRAQAFAQAILTRSQLQIEYRVIWRNGSVHWIASYAEFIPSDQDEGMFYGVAQDISDRKFAEAALRESEARLRVLIENLPGGAAFVVDRDLRYLLAEGEALSIAGFKPEDLVGRTIREAMPPELVANYEMLYRTALAGEPFEQEHDAHDHAYVSRGIPLRSEDEVYAVLAVSYDISDRKRAEAALRESEEKYRTLFDSIDEAFCLLEIIDDEQGVAVDLRYHDTNRVFERQTGIANAEGKRAHELIPNLEPFWIEIYDQVARTGEPVRFENYVQGTDHWFNVYASRVGGAGSRFVAAVFDDITERKQSERELTKTNQLLQATFDSSLQIIQLFKAVRDERGDIVDFEWLLTNKQWNDRWGDVAGKRLLTENPAVIETGLFDKFKQVTQSGIPDTHEYYYAYEQFNGWFLQTVAKVEDGFLLSTLDITERKLAEAAVRRSEARQAYLLKLSDAIRPLSDAVDITETVTRTAINYFKADRCYYCEIEGDVVTIRRDAHREDLPSVANVYSLNEMPLFKSVSQSGQPIVVRDVNASDVMDDALKQLCLAVNILSYINVPILKDKQLVGNFCLTQCTARDWTDVEIDFAKETAERTWVAIERARAEEVLAVSEEKYRTLFNSMDEAYAVVEVIADENGAGNDFLFLEVNPAFIKQTGMEYPVGRRATELLGTPNSHWAQIYGQVAATGESVRFEEREPTLGRIFDLYAFRLGGEGSRRVAVLFNDITRRKQSEQALRESEARYRATVTLVPALLWQIDSTGQNITHNPHWLEYTGQTFEESQRDGWQAAIHPDDLPNTTRAFDRAYAIATALEVEHRIRRRDGVYRWFVVRQVPLKDEAGKVVRWFGAATDIHAAHVAAETLGESEARLQRAICIETVGVLFFDPEGTFTDANDAFLKMSGFTRKQIEQRCINTAEMTLPEWMPRTQQAIAELAAMGRTTPYEKELRRPDGSRWWGLFSATRLNEMENVEYVVDITDRKRADEALRQSEQKLQSAIAVAQLSPYEWNPMTGELKWDARLKAMWGLSADAQINYEIHNAGIHPKDREYVERQVAKAFDPNGDGIFAAEFRTVGIEDNIERWVSARGQTFFDDLGRPVRYVGAAQDVSDRKQAEADRIQLIQEQANRLEAERLNQMKDEFLAMVSHELQSPMVAILGWTRLLRANPPAGAMLMKHLETIERNATLQAKLIQDLLDISRITAGKLCLILQPVQLEVVIENAIAAVETATIIKNIGLQYQTTDQATALIMGDRDRLQQVFCNLLSNAIKFTPKSGSVTVELSTIKNENLNYAKIRVIDTGIGIAAEFLPHVFDRFRQAEKSGSAGGLGLGLAIARHLVQLHNGTIDAASSGVGQGATFTVKLPILQEL